MQIKVLLLQKGVANDFTFNRIYGTPLKNLLGNNLSSIVQAPLHYPDGVKKVPATEKKEWLNHVEDKLNQFDVILCSDGEYFKVLAGTSKAEGTVGVMYDSKYTTAKVMYVPSVSACNYHPDKNLTKLDIVFNKLLDYTQNQYEEVGTGIIHSYEHALTIPDIKRCLDSLHQYPALTFDIEARALRFTEAGIYTVCFAWDKHNYIGFPVDAFASETERKEARKLLKEFLNTYKGNLKIHKANYDATVVCYTLFQNEDINDIKGQVEGLNILFGEDTQRIDDTLVITYLATNSTAGNVLGLKELASEFAGDWAVDVKDVTKVPLDELLTYNGVDCLSTWYVYEKYYPMMVQDDQEELYRTFMLPTLKTNIRCQLNGLPINAESVLTLEKDLQLESASLCDTLYACKEVEEAQWKIAEEVTAKRNSKLKKKQTTVEENLKLLNLHSPKQLQVLLYDVMGLPVIETTATKEPAVGKKVLKDLMNHTDNVGYKSILQALCDLADVDKILTGFIPAFKDAYVKDPSQLSFLIGNFNLGGTVSGRLSSSQPNLQNLPATSSRFAKPVKKLFQSTDEWIYCGIDFSSLEDRISALTTKDPEKLKVYLNGYDGHCLRAYSYFKQHMPDITAELEKAVSEEQKVEIINSIADRYPSWRQLSKAPTFALTYGGTYLTLMKNCGFDEVTAKEIETAYHALYTVSDEWVQEHIKQACVTGYVTTGFGLRVRTPILRNTVYSDHMPNLAAAEARTAGNALGQGWGVLNDRAMNEVIEQVDKLGLSEHILPVGKIHDACYYKVRNDIDIILTINRLTTQAARWQDHPVIAHDEVHLSGQLDLFYPDWAHPITLPEECDEGQLIQIVQKALEKN